MSLWVFFETLHSSKQNHPLLRFLFAVSSFVSSRNLRRMALAIAQTLTSRLHQMHLFRHPLNVHKRLRRIRMLHASAAASHRVASMLNRNRDTDADGDDGETADLRRQAQQDAMAILQRARQIRDAEGTASDDEEGEDEEADDDEEEEDHDDDEIMLAAEGEDDEELLLERLAQETERKIRLGDDDNVAGKPRRPVVDGNELEDGEDAELAAEVAALASQFEGSLSEKSKFWQLKARAAGVSEDDDGFSMMVRGRSKTKPVAAAPSLLAKKNESGSAFVFATQTEDRLLEDDELSSISGLSSENDSDSDADSGDEQEHDKSKQRQRQQQQPAQKNVAAAKPGKKVAAPAAASQTRKKKKQGGGLFNVDDDEWD